MSIKDQLRAAILSGGMNGSAPSTSTSITLADNTKNFVPPCDGYLHFRGELDSNDKWLSLFQYDYGRSYDNTGSSPLEDVIRVRKGVPVLFNAKGGLLIKQLKFFKCVGGGKNPVAQLIWRAVPCLRTCLTRALTPIADRIRVSSQGAILQLTSRSRQGMRMLTQPLTFLRATACSLFSVSPLKATPTTTSRFDEISSTVGSLGATGRRGRFLRLLAERAKRFTGTRGLMELLRASKRTSAFTHTSALNVCFGGASYE